MFSMIVIIHEFWHFSAARKFWVKVEEFWLWIPPKAKELFTDKKWTIFTLNWLPIWGFVRLKGENPAGLENKDDSEALCNKSYIAQSIIILGWVFMNFLLAIIIFSILFFVWVKPVWINNKIETNLDLKLIPTQQQAIESWLLQEWKWILLYPVEWSIAEKSGIQEGDNLLEIDWKIINWPEDAMGIIWASNNSEVVLTVIRKTECGQTEQCLNNTQYSLKITPNWEWKIWSYLSPNISINDEFEYKYWVIESIKHWILETYNQSLLTVKAIWILVKKLVNPETPQERTQAVENMRWPIGIVDLVANSLEAWIIFLLILSAIISINLWVFNLLPIPALDWWRFVFISINAFIAKIFWKEAITQNLENLIHVFFFMVLIALSILIWYNDVVNIINR